MRELRARIIHDPDPDYSYLEQRGAYGEPLFGDLSPDDLETLAVVAEARCPCCGRWESLASSLWGIDVMADDRTLIGVPYEGDPIDVLRDPDREGGTYMADELREWMANSNPESGRYYLATVALEVLAEAEVVPA